MVRTRVQPARHRESCPGHPVLTLEAWAQEMPRLSSTTPKHATLLKHKPYLRKLSHTTRSAAGRQEHGKHAL